MSVNDQANRRITRLMPQYDIPDDMQQKTEFVDMDTGEIMEGIFISDQELKGAHEKEKQKSKNKAYRKVYDDLVRAMMEFGQGEGFFFYRYNEFLEAIDYDYATAFRFLYISTWSDYDGVLRFSSSPNRKGCAMTIEDVKNEFAHSRYMNNATINKLLELNLISDCESFIKVNTKYIIKGSIPDDAKYFTSRVFINGIRKLYRLSEPKEHKQLGRVIALFPFTHMESNILCWNPMETDPKKIRPLGPGDIAEIIGYDRSNQRRIRKSLLSVKVHGYGLLGAFLIDESITFVMNPYIFYRGSDLESIAWLKNVFTIGNTMPKSEAKTYQKINKIK